MLFLMLQLRNEEFLFPTFRGNAYSNVNASKPGKYGIKVWSIVDASNVYHLNARVYTGKGPFGPEQQQAKRVVRNLTTPIKLRKKFYKCFLPMLALL